MQKLMQSLSAIKAVPTSCIQNRRYRAARAACECRLQAALVATVFKRLMLWEVQSPCQSAQQSSVLYQAHLAESANADARCVLGGQELPTPRLTGGEEVPVYSTTQ